MNQLVTHPHELGNGTALRFGLSQEVGWRGVIVPGSEIGTDGQRIPLFIVNSYSGQSFSISESFHDGLELSWRTLFQYWLYNLLQTFR